MKSLTEASWLDSSEIAEFKASRKKPMHKPMAGDDGLFPKPLSTATISYNMRQIPQRGMAEMLQAYRDDPWLHRVIDIIARKFSMVPWSLYERPNAKTSAGGGPRRLKIPKKYHASRGEWRHKMLSKALDTGELREIEEHPLLDLIHTPNPVMSGVAFRDLCNKYLDMQGESFILKRRDALGIVYELWPLSPTWIFRVPTQDMPFFDVSVLGKTLRVSAKDMIWMKHLELLNPYTRGSGQGESLGSYIDTSHYGMQLQKSFFINDARPDMIVWMANANQQSVLDFQDKMENSHRGPLRKFRPMVLDGPQKPEVTQLDSTTGINVSIPILDKVRDVFVSVFGVPPELAGILESSNRATIDAAETILARQTIEPRCEFWLDEMSRQLVGTEFGEDLLLGFDNPVPEDLDRKLNILKAAPWIADVGEWRAFANLPSRGDADKFYMVPTTFLPTPDASKQVIPTRHNITTQNGVEGTSNITAGTHFIGPGMSEDLMSGAARDDAGERPDDAAGASEPAHEQLYADVVQPFGDAAAGPDKPAAKTGRALKKKSLAFLR